MSHRYLGTPRPLIEGREKVTGGSRYAADLTLPGMLHARPILSPYAYAHLGAIDATAALALPGVVAVLTAADLPTRDQPITSRNSAVLARERVLWAGQPVALVVAESAAVATDAAELVQIAYEPLPAAVELTTATQPDAPLVWTDAAATGNELVNVHAVVDGSAAVQVPQLRNVAAANRYARGDVEGGLAASAVVVARTYRTQSVHQSYLEPHACVAEPAPDGRGVTLYTATQGKFLVRDEVADLLGLRRRDVHVRPLTFGGGFGAKYGILEPLAAAAALTVGRPISIVFSRSDDLLATTPAPGILIELRTGATAEGLFHALHARVWIDNGAFGFSHGGIIGNLLGGFYRVPNLLIETYEVRTHKTPVGAYRAPGSPQTSFALESNVDEMAAALGSDPLTFRLRNVAATGDPMGSGRPWPSLGLREVLARIAEHPLWQQPELGPHEGLGLAIGGWATISGAAEAICRVDNDGAVTVEMGHVDVSGNDSSLVLIVADALGVDPADVTIVHGETTGGAYGPESGGSQVTYTVAGAVERAAQAVRQKLLDLAADELEADTADLELVAGTVQVRGVPDKALPIGDLAETARTRRGGPGPIVGEGRAAPPVNAPAVSAHLVKVRIDPETGEIRPLRYVVAQDVGFALNPLLVEGQIHGGMAQGVGMGLYEQMAFDEYGQLLSSSFVDYAFPRSDMLPTLEALAVENPSPHGPFGARGVGEPPITGGPAALANAVKQATGVRLTELPLRAETLWRALRTAVGEPTV